MSDDRLPEENIEALETLALPWGREIKFEAVAHESGMKLLRLRIREGRRFTILDLDRDAAKAWSAALAKWGDKI